MNLMNIEQNAENLRLLGLIVAQRGETIYQHNWDSPCRRLLFSASKSFTGAAVGFAVQEGLLRLDDRLIELFPDEAPENPSENLCRATIRDALTMCIGQSRGYLMGAQRVGMAEEDWAKAVLALPFDEAPGTHFVYSNGAASVWEIWNFIAAYSAEQNLTRDHVYNNRFGNIVLLTDGETIEVCTNVDPADFNPYQPE